MTNGVGSIGSASGVISTPAVVAPAASGTFTVANTNASSEVSLKNPRVVLDPTIGYVTEYLSANGSQVVSQTPSAVTIAYLRLGLTAQGLPKPAEPGHVGTTA